VEIRAYVESKPWADQEVLYLVLQGGEQTKVLRLNSEGDVIAEPIQNTAEVPPFLTLRGQWAREVFPAIIAALTKKGYELPSESQLKGKCEAMSAHLADLRQMLKLK
jgi:hypothetical protein